MSGTNNGGPVRPGATWSDPDEREAFFPGTGAIRATERVLAEDLQPDPIALSERLPEPEDCRCITPSTERDGAYIWAGSVIHSTCLRSFWNWDLVNREYMITNSVSGHGPPLYTHWLPASVRYLPARVEL